MKGIFYFKNNDGYSLLRLYPNGLIFGISITEISSLNKIKWFNQFNYKPFWGKGQYSETKGKIEFILSSISGEVVYRGEIINEDEIDFEVDSLINGHRSKRKYKRLIKLPEKENFIERQDDGDNYPIILIPESIKQSIIREIPKSEIYEYLKIEVPKLQKLKEPSYPKSYVYIEKEKTKFVGDLVETIAMGTIAIFFIIVSFYSLIRGNAFIFLLFLAFSIFFFRNLGRFKKSKEIEKADISDIELKKQVDNYNEEIGSIKSKNAEYEKEYFKDLALIDKKIKNKIEDAKREIYYQTLNPYCGILEKKENVKRGKTELMFLCLLIEQFGEQILVDSFLDLPYQNFQPDFILNCNITGLQIDIEIDEPYSFAEKNAIHYIGADDNRNEAFLQQNWCVIRFSERQIIQYPHKCIKLIFDFLTSIRNKTEQNHFDLEKDKKWTYEEALVMSHKNIRNEY